jgi:hypothetical protein
MRRMRLRSRRTTRGLTNVGRRLRSRRTRRQRRRGTK